jgi:hypothetical protein
MNLIIITSIFSFLYSTLFRLPTSIKKKLQLVIPYKLNKLKAKKLKFPVFNYCLLLTQFAHFFSDGLLSRCPRKCLGERTYGSSSFFKAG